MSFQVEPVRPLLPQTIDFLRRKVSEGFPNASIKQLIPVIASQLLDQIISTSEFANSMKARTYSVINDSMDFLCYRGCETGHSDEDAALCENQVGCIAVVDWGWDEYQKQIRPALRSKESPKIEKIKAFLKIISDELIGEKTAIQRSAIPAFKNFSVRSESFLESEERVRKALMRCPWHKMALSGLSLEANPQSDRYIPQLLKDLRFSFELMLNDKQTIDFSEVAVFIHGLLPAIRELERDAVHEKTIAKLFPRIKDLVSQLKSKICTAPSVSIHESLHGSVRQNFFLINRETVFSKAAKKYGWKEMIEVIEQSMEPQRIGRGCLELFELSPLFLQKSDAILSDLADWLDVLHEDSSFDELNPSFTCARMFAAMYITDIDSNLQTLRSLVRFWATEPQITHQSFQDFERQIKTIVSNMEIALSLLEAAIIRYDDASEYLTSERARRHRKTIELNRDAIGDLPPMEQLGEVPAEQKNSMLEWLEAICLPLEGIIEALKNLPEPLVREEAPREVKEEAASLVQAKRKRHKKKKTPLACPASLLAAASAAEAVAADVFTKPEGSADFLEEPAPSLLSPEPAVPLGDDRESVPPIEPESPVLEWAPDFSAAPDHTPEVLVPARIRRKDREQFEVHRLRGEKCRKLKRLLMIYGGYEQKAGGRHPMFEKDHERVPLPFHGGSGSISKGVTKRIQALIHKMDQ